MTVYVCPHFDISDGENQRMLAQLFSKVADERRSNPEMFEFTHRKMQVYELDSSQLVPEDEVLRRIHKKRHKNHVSVIEGNVGTGKSELCAYLYLELRKRREKVLYLEKSADIVRMLTEDIPAFYEECVGRPLPQKRALDELRTKLRTPGILAEFGALGLILAFELGETFKGLEDAKAELAQYATRKLGRVATTPSVDAEIFEAQDIPLQPQLAWSLPFKEKIGGSWEDVATEMSRRFWEIVYQQTKAPNLVDTVRQLQKDCPQERLYIIFEDYSFSRADTKKLLTFLEDDKASNKCEVVIAGLHDRIFGSTLAEATALDRFDYYRTNDETGRVPFLQEEDAFGFVLPFLAYPKAKDRSVKWDDGSPDPTHPAPRSRCAVCQQCPVGFRAAFPFTEPFLQKLYEGLHEKRPRVLIDTVIKSIEHYAAGKTAISSSPALGQAKRSDYFDTIEDEDTREFMAWYGTISARGLSAPAFVAKIMGIDGSQLVHEQDSLTYVPSTVKDRKKEKKPEDPLERDFEELAGWIPNWRNDPLDPAWQTTSIYIMQGIADALGVQSDGFRLADNCPVKVAFKKGELPVVVVGQTAHLSQILVDPKDLTVDQARAFLRYGYYGDKKRAVTLDEIEAVGSEQLAQWVDEWRAKLISYLKMLRFSNRAVGGGQAGLGDLAKAAYCIAAFLKDPRQEPSFSTLQALYTKGGALAVHPEVARRLDEMAKATIERFLGPSAALHAWIGFHFGLDQSTLDKTRLGDHLSLSAMVGMASTLSSGDIKAIGQGTLTIDGETFSGPVNLLLGDEGLRDAITHLKAVANGMLETPFAREGFAQELAEVRRFVTAYGPVEAHVLGARIGNVLTGASHPGLTRERLQSVHAIASSHEKYDLVRRSAARIGELLQDGTNEMSVSLAWYMWQLVVTDRDYQDLTAFLDELTSVAGHSEGLGAAMERLRATLLLFDGVNA